MQKIRKAVIPAAGYGTRFLPATKATPKEMLPIVDKPTIQYIVEEAVASGIEDILIISGHGKRAIEDHFDSAPALEAELLRKGKTELLKMVQETADINIHYIRQRYMRGLGDAILCAHSFMGNEPFAVLLGDDVVNRTVPLILCAEENVEGTHGATIGALDDDTLFYFESRGFDRDAAERLMARAAVERLAQSVFARQGDETHG